MLSAAEAAIDASAEDDAERQRNRARLYAPPAGSRPRSGGRAAGAVRGGGMRRDAAESLMAQLAAQDAKLSAGRNS
ncbi:hypothetical protein ACLQ2N_16060 [Streptomyces sp. DT224]|uniref:hypothetical protein n=1 Tax=Streptomyces sp. DT224 TaxID=3393426 RepID=UPI003CEEB7B8